MTVRRPTASLACALLLCTAFAAAPAAAGIITYEVTPLGDSQWRYDYEVINDDDSDDGVDAIYWFALFFDYDLFASLGDPGVPEGWDPLLQQPDRELPDDGVFDLYAPGSPVLPGVTLGGFSLIVTMIGNATPGSQRFDILGEDPGAPLFTGMTVARTTAVPEPGTALLLGLGLAALGVARRRRPAAASA
jgi:hypothetical protein